MEVGGHLGGDYKLFLSDDRKKKPQQTQQIQPNKSKTRPENRSLERSKRISVQTVPKA